MTEKKKILIIADSPMAPSGVGTQTKYMIDGLMSTGRYKVLCLAGAIKHHDYTVKSVSPYGEDWLIRPVDGYGNPQIIRAALDQFRPDVLWFMTDPRFYIWLWDMEDEIRPNVPMLYYHVWDNYPYPTFNAKYYKSNDLVCTISKLTHDIVTTLAPDTETIRVPHAVDNNVFRKLPDSETLSFRETLKKRDRVFFFYNSRNARRKMTGSIIFWFKEFLDEVGHDKAGLLLHTEPKDPNGQDLDAIIKHLGLTEGQVMLSTKKLAPLELAKLYNIMDCTICVSDAEGFGLSVMESLSCEKPVIVNMTGGPQEQVTDGKDFFGVGIEPASRAIIGSQDVPWIYEDRISKEDFISALRKIFNMSQEEREEKSKKGREYMLRDYSMENYKKQWIEIMDNFIEKNGSWNTRKNYKSWELTKIA